MPNIILTDNQLLKVTKTMAKEKQIQSIQEKWNSCDTEQRVFVLEFLKQVHPDKKKKIDEVIKKVKKNNLNEAWYNTLLDIVGWIDPTGIADALNGVIYLSNGDYLFGFLSFVGAIPYVGDVVAKPVMYALKLGKPSTKALNGIMKLSKAGKTTEAASELAKLSSQSGLVSTFVKGMGKIGTQLEGLIKAMPGGVLKGFKNTLLEWIQLFKNAAKSGTVSRQVTANLAKRMARMTPAQQVENLKQLKTAMKGAEGTFTGYRTGNKFFSWKTFWGGMPQLMGRNRSVRALMRKTKWYLGLLDFLGIGNFVGPDELLTKMGDAKYEQSIQEYNKTAQAQQYASEDFGDSQIPMDDIDAVPATTSQTSNQPQQKSSMMDPLSWLLASSLKPR